MKAIVSMQFRMCLKKANSLSLYESVMLVYCAYTRRLLGSKILDLMLYVDHQREIVLCY